MKILVFLQQLLVSFWSMIDYFFHGRFLEKRHVAISPNNSEQLTRNREEICIDKESTPKENCL